MSTSSTSPVSTACDYPQPSTLDEHKSSTPRYSIQHIISPSNPEPQSKTIVLWSSEDGRTQTSVEPETGSNSGNKATVGWKPLPFQYQIPINKYSTLHSVASKRSAFQKRTQSDLDSHRATIAISRTLLNAVDKRDSQHTDPADSEKSPTGSDEDNEDDEIVSKPESMTSMSAAEVVCGNALGMSHYQQQYPGILSSPTRRSGSDELRKKVDQLDEKNAVTDMVIRRLTEQIARLQSNISTSAATVSMATTSSAMPNQSMKNSSSDDQILNTKKRKTMKDAGVQVDTPQDLMTSSTMNSIDEDGIATDLSGTSEEILDQCLAYKIREATMLGHVNDYRRRFDELKFVNDMQEAQITRLNEEMSRLKELLVESRGKEREQQSLVADLRISMRDLHEKHDYHTMLSQLRSVEFREATEELQRKISQLETEKYRLITALQSTGALGYYAVANCTAHRDRDQPTLNNSRLATRDVQNFNASYDDFSDDDEYVRNVAAVVIESLAASKSNHDDDDASQDFTEDCVTTAVKPPIRRSSIATSASMGDMRTAKMLSISPLPRRSRVRVENCERSPSIRRREARRNDTSSARAVFSDGEIRTGRQRVSFLVTPTSDSSTTNLTPKSLPCADSSYSTGLTLPVAPSPTSHHSVSGFDRLPTTTLSVMSPKPQSPITNHTSGSGGETIVVQAVIEPLPYNVTSPNTNNNDVVASSSRDGGSSSSSPKMTSTLPRLKRRVVTSDRSNRSANGESLLSSYDSSDSARESNTGSVMATKPVARFHSNHARLIGDELVVFNGVD